MSDAQTPRPHGRPGERDDKDRQLDQARSDSDGTLTTSIGVKIADTDNSLKAGRRGAGEVPQAFATVLAGHCVRGREVSSVPA